MVENETLELLKEYINLLNENRIRIKYAYLYGSYLNNSNSENSDIDLMLVTENDCDDFEIGKIWSLTRKVNSKIEPYIINYQSFINNINSPILALVKRDGFLINYEKN